MLIAGLGSKNEDVRKRASALLATSDDPAAATAVAELLDHQYGYVVAEAIEVLCDLASPAVEDKLRAFADRDDRFDLVWRANDQLHTLADDGFAQDQTGFGVDGLALGGFRYDGSERVPLPRRRLIDGPLLDLLTDVRTAGLEAARHQMDFDAVHALGVYMGVELEVSQTDLPIPAIEVRGFCDADEFALLRARHPTPPKVVDVTGLGFLAPNAKADFTQWLEGGESLAIGNPDNPYPSSLPRVHEAWPDAIQALIDEGYAVPPIDIIGYWTAKEDDRLPHPEDFVATTPDPDAEQRLADLLDDGITYVYSMGYSPCRICGVHNGSAELTDGRFSWPEGLSHYVRDHHVALPPAIISQLRPRPSVDEGRWMIASMMLGRPASTDLWARTMATRTKPAAETSTVDEDGAGA